MMNEELKTQLHAHLEKFQDAKQFLMGYGLLAHAVDDLIREALSLVASTITPGITPTCQWSEWEKNNEPASCKPGPPCHWHRGGRR